ncbi:hypothetical protein PZ938_10410 [Luteipulveratus sp. YIM 133132]|uniref:Anthranilate synthase n=1 Tax=Luteipulveratus flavus TaxID=3031728 RepID=A0ABT6C716_9MICO|nr:MULTISPECIES: HGxxPAAW family protein [unclassified Luteipulveratus]MDE9366015.1 hypothetical protein [Luteipulveratus sp. YIM 133132]MDF8264117.1 hypothetical protein [Luteipulveratus sp. YIM 133296]
MSAEHHDDHGHSVAAWTGVFALIFASALIAVGVAWGAHLWTIIGLVVAVLGLVAAFVLSRTGFGVHAKRLPPQQRTGVR